MSKSCDSKKQKTDISDFVNEGFTFVQKLGEDKVTLHKRHESFKKVMKELTQHYESIKARLNENETYAQVN